MASLSDFLKGGRETALPVSKRHLAGVKPAIYTGRTVNVLVIILERRPQMTFIVFKIKDFHKQSVMMMWQVKLYFLKVQYLQNVTADVQNILGLYQQWYNDKKYQKIVFAWSFPSMFS
jgi:hypothetical protein